MKEKFKYSSTVNNDQFAFANGDTANLDFIPVDENHFHIIKDNKKYLAELVKADYYAKTFTLNVNGNYYDILLKDTFDNLAESMGLSVESSAKMNEVNAPMPGLILDIMVKEGDQVEKGTPLLILEAMKMENVIKATGVGAVKKIEVTQNTAVAKGDVLISF